MAGESFPESLDREPEIEGGFFLCGPDGSLSGEEREVVEEFERSLMERYAPNRTGEAIDDKKD